MSKPNGHTPGPWKLEDDAIVGPRYICNLADWYLVAAGGQYEEQEAALRAERDANARLIAAAPDLLAACKLALTSAAPCEPMVELQVSRANYAKIVAAIFKAEGGVV